MGDLRVLLIDASGTTRVAVEEQLLDRGHRLRVVDSGEAALSELNDFDPALLLLDISGGVGEWADLLRRLRKAMHHWVPIIALADSLDEADYLLAIGAGADDYLVTPLNPLIFDMRLQALLRIATLQQISEAVVETMLDGVIRIDRVGRIISVNRAAALIFQYEPAALVGRNVSCLMPTPDRERHDEYIGNYMATGERKVIGLGREVLGMRRDGSVFPMHLGVSELRLPGGACFIGVVRDLSDEASLVRRLAKLTGADATKLCPASGGEVA